MGGGLSNASLSLLASFGWKIHDYSAGSKAEFVKKIFKPLYSAKQAQKANRKFPEGWAPNQRTDGWATYYKFYVWRDFQFRIMMTDLDVCFMSNPDDFVYAIPSESEFVASPEYITRGYKGFNSHMMIFTPSMQRYEEIVRRASAG